MSVVAFVVLALLAAAVIAYPLLAARKSLPTHGRYSATVPADLGEADIESAVRALLQCREGAKGAVPQCPMCGKPIQAGDLFCVGCGAPQAKVAAVRGRGQAPAPISACPDCGAAYREGDRFCARCGRPRAAEEAR